MRDWEFLGRRVLSVSRHLPAEDGIANYADMLVEQLREDREVRRLGIPYGGGDEVVVLWGWLRPLRLLPRARGYDDVLVQYHPHYYLRGSWASRVAGLLALAALARLLPVTWVMHELDEERPEEIGRRGKAMFAVEEAARRLLWRGARRVVFHSDWERRRFRERFGAARRREERVVSHEAHFRSPVSASRAEAREALGLPADRAILLCIGTLSPHKAVDAVIAAFAAGGLAGCELHVVGRPIRPMPEVLAHVEELRGLVAATPGVHLREEYVSDEHFDLWIRAADAVVVGYRAAASSGVVARAHVLGTTVITSGAGGIAEQTGPSDLVFSGHDELVEAMRAVAGRRV